MKKTCCYPVFMSKTENKIEFTKKNLYTKQKTRIEIFLKNCILKRMKYRFSTFLKPFIPSLSFN